jgi:hypothetical protein
LNKKSLNYSFVKAMQTLSEFLAKNGLPFFGTFGYVHLFIELLLGKLFEIGIACKLPELVPFLPPVCYASLHD